MVICVAGPIAAGKNFVCSILEERGFFCLDADEVIHKIIGDKQAAILSRFSQIAASRGINLRTADGSLDRRALGKLLFKDRTLLAEQEKILYPEFVARVQALIDAEIAGKPKTARGLAINAALLYKTPSLLRQCQKIIYVDEPLLVRAWRIRRRDRLPFEQIFRRIKSQKGLMQEYERFAADYGIEMVVVRNWGKRLSF